jgi:hypothetical protein
LAPKAGSGIGEGGARECDIGADQVFARTDDTSTASSTCTPLANAADVEHTPSNATNFLTANRDRCRLSRRYS